MRPDRKAAKVLRALLAANAEEGDTMYGVLNSERIEALRLAIDRLEEDE